MQHQIHLDKEAHRLEKEDQIAVDSLTANIISSSRNVFSETCTGNH